MFISINLSNNIIGQDPMSITNLSFPKAIVSFPNFFQLISKSNARQFLTIRKLWGHVLSKFPFRFEAIFI